MHIESRRSSEEHPKKIPVIGEGDISEFEVVEGTVFLHNNDADKEPVKERSLMAIEDITGGYFRKIGRNKAIRMHMLKRCM